MGKKFWSVALCLCMVMTLLPTGAGAYEYVENRVLHIGSIAVTLPTFSEDNVCHYTYGNDSEVLGTDVTSVPDTANATWWVDFSGNLTLSGATITGAYTKDNSKYGIYAENFAIFGAFTITLQGANTVAGSDNAGSGNSSYGIYSTDGLLLQGSGSMTVSGGAAETSCGLGVGNSSAISITGGTIIATGQQSALSKAPKLNGVHAVGSTAIAGDSAVSYVSNDNGNYKYFKSSPCLYLNGVDMYADGSDTVYWKNGDTSSCTGSVDDWNAKFDVAAAALTLKNAVINTAHDTAVVNMSGSDYRIVLEGKNTIAGTNNTTIGQSSGILLDNHLLTISGDGTLNVTGGTSSSQTANGAFSEGISTRGDISITGGTVIATAGTATGKDCSLSYGIGTTGIVSISGSAIVTATGGTATGGTATGGTVTSAPYISGGIEGQGGISISDSAVVSAAGGTSKQNSDGLLTNDACVVKDDSSVTATGGEAGAFSCGIDSNRGVAISGGTVNATGGEAVKDSYGIYSKFGNPGVAVYGGTVVAFGGEAGQSSCGVYGDKYGVGISGGTVSATGGSAGSTGTSCGIDSSTSVKLSGGVTVARAGMVNNSFNSAKRYAVHCDTADGIKFHGDGADVPDTTKIAGAVGYTKSDGQGTFGAMTDYLTTGQTITGTVNSETSQTATGVVIVPTGYAVKTAQTSTDGISGDTAIVTETAAALKLDAGKTVNVAENKTLVAVSLFEGDSGSADGILDSGALTLSGADRIIAVGGMSADSCGVQTGALTIPADSTLNLTAIGGTSLGTARDECSYGVKAATGVNIGGGTVTAIGGSAIGSQDLSCGIYSGDAENSAPLTISGPAKVTAIGGVATFASVGLLGSTCTVSSGRVTAIGNTAGGMSLGMKGTAHTSAVTISGGTVTSIGGTAGLNSYGIDSESVTISGGAGTAASGVIESSEPGASSQAMEVDPSKENNVVVIGTCTDKLVTWRGPDYLLTVALNGGNGGTAGGNYVNGENVSISAGTRSGYNFSGWTSSVGGAFADTSKADTIFTMPSNDTTITAAWTSVSSGGGITTPVTDASSILVDNTVYQIGKTTTSEGTTIVTANQEKLEAHIAEGRDSVTFPIPGEKDSSMAQLVVLNIEKMAAKGMNLNVETKDVTVQFPTTAVDTDKIMTATGAANAADVPFKVSITKLAADSVTTDMGTTVFQPVTVRTIATYGNTTVPVDRLSQYGQCILKLPDNFDGGKITTALRTEDATTASTARLSAADVKASEHVPTNVYQKDGKWYAAINSLTNGTYVLVYNVESFADAASKWYADAANEMASRCVVFGRTDGTFDGDASVTRAEFAAMAVRALGLPTDGKSSFTDVKSTDWFASAVGVAAEYGLVNGYEDGSFKPDASITRQEAMAMAQRAAKVAELTGKTGELTAFSDANSVADWAKAAAQFNVGSGLIVGKGSATLDPTGSITRAESATVLLRLLQNAKLVDVRSKV